MIYLDLRAVSFLGAAGAAVLVAATFAGRAAGRSVVLGKCSPQAHEALVRTGALDVIDAGKDAADRRDAQPARRVSSPVEHRDRRPARTTVTRALQPT